MPRIFINLPYFCRNSNKINLKKMRKEEQYGSRNHEN